MSFYKLENATINEANQIIEKLDEEDKKDYLLKAVYMPYISNQIFALLVDCFKAQSHVLSQAFSEIATQMATGTEINPKLYTLLATGTDFSQVASQSLINGAYTMNSQTASWLIANGADACFGDNSALRNAISENNTPVLNVLLKHGNNSLVYEQLLSTESFNFDGFKNLSSLQEVKI